MSVAVQSIQSLPALDRSPYDLSTVENGDKNGEEYIKHVRLSPARQWRVPASAWQSLRHPRADQISGEVNGYFVQHWQFPDFEAEKKFVNAGFPNVTCLYFPLAKGDRIHFACRLLTVLFLIDGKACLEVMHYEKTNVILDRRARRHVIC